MSSSRGTRISVDDAFLIVPFNPSMNSDYSVTPAYSDEYAGKQTVGLLALALDTGSTVWCNIYTSANSGAVVPVDGDISPDNIRYYFYV